MQITADISKILKTVRCDLSFIFDELWELVIGFVSFLVSCVVKKVVSFRYNSFSRKRGSIVVCNYVEMCKGICSYNLVYNFFVLLLQSKFLW